MVHRSGVHRVGLHENSARQLQISLEQPGARASRHSNLTPPVQGNNPYSRFEGDRRLEAHPQGPDIMRSLPCKREIGAELLGRGGLMGIARAQRNTIRILAYHRVLPGNCAEWCPVSPNFIFDDGVVSATSE